MRIKKLSETKVIMSAPGSSRNYFAWPTAAVTKDGRIAVACSGFRLEHICPFGKAVICFSDDNGETFSAPEAVIDTVLDDRDAGLCPFGESGLILTSFNNSVEFQRNNCTREHLKECLDYLDTVSPEDEEKTLGSEFRISLDNGRTWGEIYRSPITSPHGPTELRDGRILWVGRIFSEDDSFKGTDNFVQVWEIKEDGSMSYISSIENIEEDGILLNSCEPHMIELSDGTLICHIRMEGGGFFSTYQSESTDGGLTWSKPHALLPKRGGAPAHLLKHSSGVLISAYGYREKPYGIRVMLSNDNGRTWQTDNVLYDAGPDDDLGYPATVELHDGSLLTVFYSHEKDDSPAVIMAQKWELEL